MPDLVESFRNASKKARHKSGGVSLVCLDDENLDQSDYGRIGDRTVVPRSRLEGGIMGLKLGNDCKYGKGVTRRKLADDGNGGFIVESVEDNFRPDKAIDLFSDEMLEAAGVQLADEDDYEDDTPADDPLAVLRKQAREAINGEMYEPRKAARQQPVAPQPQNGSEALMMQMMQMMASMMTQSMPKPEVQYTVEDKPRKQPKEQLKSKSVSFSGNFGRITVQYADVMLQSDFIVLVSVPGQPAMYEPPLSSQHPLALEVDGVKYSVMNLGLSFTHKGDILHLMPFALNPEDADAE